MSPFQSESEYLEWRIARLRQMLAENQGEHDDDRLRRLIREAVDKLSKEPKP